MQTNTQHRSAAQPFLSEENVIFTNKAPLPLGTYSQGIKVSHGQTIYLSAQTPVSALNNEVLAQDFEGQLRQTLDNLCHTLEAAGSSLDAVTQVLIYVTDRRYLAAVNSLYADYFQAPYPNRAAIVVAGLAREEMLVELVVYACL